MQAAKSAREALFGESQVGQLQEDVNLNAIRYFVQMGWGKLGVDTHGIPNQHLLRGEITPCRTYPQKANLLEIREADLIPGSEQADKDGRTVYGFYRRHAYYEAERLIDLETRAERQTGLVEVKALRGDLGNEVYRKVDLNKLFFPAWPEMPEKNEEVVSQLEARIEELKQSIPAGIPANYVPVIFEVGDQLLEAVRKVDAIQKHLLTYTHTCMKQKPGDEAFKRQYDNVDYEMLARTGLPQIHAAEIQTAQALEKLTERETGGGNGELLKLMQQQIVQQGQMLELLMAERKSNKPNASGK